MATDIAFYLPGRPFGGGVNSVVQEFAALVHNYGLGNLVVAKHHLDSMRRGYQWSGEALSRLSADLSEVPEGAAVVATTNDSLRTVIDEVGDRASRIYYYVQDYEPLFYAPYSKQYHVALASYAMAQQAVAVVKTRWLADTMLAQTFFPVIKIRPSINRDIYRPMSRPESRRRTIVAMVRPATPRRGAARTVAVLNRLARSPSLPVDLDVFGASVTELRDGGLHLDPAIRIHGRVSAADAAHIVAESDFLLDLSDYQAFGRSAAEGMAAGVVPIITNEGAPPEFVTHGESGFLVAAHDVDTVYATCAAAVQLPHEELARMRLNAVDAVAAWSVDATAADWFALMRDA